MFKKYGDEMPVNVYATADGQIQVCPNCNTPMITTAFTDTNEVKLVCERCNDTEMPELVYGEL